MNRVSQLALIAVSLLAAKVAISQSAPASAATTPGPSAEIISQIAARLIADALPREYERSKD